MTMMSNTLYLLYRLCTRNYGVKHPGSVGCARYYRTGLDMLTFRGRANILSNLNGSPLSILVFQRRKTSKIPTIVKTLIAIPICTAVSRAILLIFYNGGSSSISYGVGWFAVSVLTSVSTSY